jgi:hypothetical protein
MIIPEIIKPPELVTPLERELRYGQRSLADLRKDVNTLFDRERSRSSEKNRQQGQIQSLIKCYHWTLGLAAFAVFEGAIDLALLCYLSWH